MAAFGGTVVLMLPANAVLSGLSSSVVLTLIS